MGGVEPSVVGLVSPDPGSLRPVARKLEALGYRVLLARAPGPHEAAAAAEELARRGAEIVVLPGSWRGPWPEASKRLGVRIVRGPWSPGLLVEIASRWGLGRLEPGVEAEKALGPDMARLAVERLKELRASPPAGSVEACGLRIPVAPPPVIVLSEVYVRSCDADEAVGEASRRILEGADIVALGWDGSVGIECYWRILRAALDRLGPLAADPGRPRLAVEAARRGACLALSVTRSWLPRIPRELRSRAGFVVIPEKLAEAAWDLLAAAVASRRLGFESLILDPIALPPLAPGLLGRLIEARRLSEAGPGYPIMLGVNNAVELLDADTSGSTAAIVALAAEAGVSVVMVGEESWKARGATWEAWASAAMASLALYWGKPPKDLGVDVLVCKEKKPRPWLA